MFVLGLIGTPLLIYPFCKDAVARTVVGSFPLPRHDVELFSICSMYVWLAVLLSGLPTPRFPSLLYHSLAPLLAAGVPCDYLFPKGPRAAAPQRSGYGPPPPLCPDLQAPRCVFISSLVIRRVSAPYRGLHSLTRLVLTRPHVLSLLQETFIALPPSLFADCHSCRSFSPLSSSSLQMPPAGR